MLIAESTILVKIRFIKFFQKISFFSIVYDTFYIWKVLLEKSKNNEKPGAVVWLFKVIRKGFEIHKYPEYCKSQASLFEV